MLSIEVVSTDPNLELFWQIRSISKDLSGQLLSKEIWFVKKQAEYMSNF